MRKRQREEEEEFKALLGYTLGWQDDLVCESDELSLISGTSRVEGDLHVV